MCASPSAAPSPTNTRATRGVLAAYLLDPMIEDAIRDAIQKTATGSYLALEPQISRDIIAAVGRAHRPGRRTARSC